MRLGSVADLEEQFIPAMPDALEHAADLAEFFRQADVVEEQVDDEAFLVIEGALKTLEVREAATMLQEPWFGWALPPYPAGGADSYRFAVRP